jgi:dephospho-CoA kinase
MLRIGLTGGIGSGKTTVAKVFEAFGVPVYYADDAAKRLMNDDPDLKKKIIREFGEESYTASGLNRAHIASIVFNDKQKLELLNSLTHPATISNAKEWMERKHHEGYPYIIKEAALLFESGSDAELDHVIGVSAPEKLRIGRVMQRDNVTRLEVSRIIERQMNEEEKLKRCDFIIINDGEQLIIPQVLLLHEKFLSKGQ